MATFYSFDFILEKKQAATGTKPSTRNTSNSNKILGLRNDGITKSTAQKNKVGTAKRNAIRKSMIIEPTSDAPKTKDQPSTSKTKSNSAANEQKRRGQRETDSSGHAENMQRKERTKSKPSKEPIESNVSRCQLRRLLHSLFSWEWPLFLNKAIVLRSHLAMKLVEANNALIQRESFSSLFKT